jgi:MFS family permease
MRMSDPSIQEFPSAPLDNAVASSVPSPAAPTGDRSARSALFIVFLVVVIDLLGFGIVLPLLPRYGDEYVGDYLNATDRSAAIATAMGTAASPFGAGPLLAANTVAAHKIGRHDWRVGALVGLLMAMFSLMQFLFAPMWGRVSDRVGRRPILLIGLVGSVIFYALFGYATDLPAIEWAGLALVLLFVSRIGAGVAGATIATAQAVVADCTPPERRKHGMALIGMAFGIGFTFGPLVAAAALFLVPNYRGVVGYVAGALSLIALILGLILLPETRRFGEAPPIKRKWFDWGATRFALGNPAVGPVVLTFFLTTLGFAMFEVTLSLLNKDAMTLSDQHNSYVFAFVGFVLAVDQGVVYRRLARRVSEPTFMAVGMLLMGLGVASLAAVSWLATTGKWNPTDNFYPLLGILMGSLVLAVTGFSFLTPSATALISRRSDPEKQGEILGVNQSASAMARILGPIAGLILYYTTADHLLPYLVAGGLMLLMLALIPSIRRGKDAFARPL